MRTRSGMFAVLAMLGVLLLSGCGSAEQKPNVAGEYFRSTQVQNDPFPTPEGFSGADRMANFASMGPPEALLGELLGVRPCSAPDCEVPMSVERVAGVGTPVQQRHAVVKHADGSLEVIDLYVAGKEGGPGVLLDTEGNSYQDLAAFQADNELLGSDDWLLIARDVTSTTDERNTPATVPGHTGPSWPLWLLVAAGLLVVLAVVVAVVRVRRSRQQGRTLEQQWQQG